MGSKTLWVVGNGERFIDVDSMCDGKLANARIWEREDLAASALARKASERVVREQRINDALERGYVWEYCYTSSDMGQKVIKEWQDDAAAIDLTDFRPMKLVCKLEE